MPNDSKSTPNFEALEQQLAKDALGKALKNLHGEITREIERNKATFSDEIKQTLNDFKKDLEQTVTLEIDQRISALLEKHFFEISSKVTSNFYESFSPVLERTKEDMQRLHMQGEKTLHSWEAMMKQFSNLWNKPFVLMLMVSVLVGAVTSVFSSYLLVRDDRNARLHFESDVHWFAKQYIEMKESFDKNAPKQEVNNQTKNNPKTQNKKK